MLNVTFINLNNCLRNNPIKLLFLLMKCITEYSYTQIHKDYHSFCNIKNIRVIMRDLLEQLQMLKLEYLNYEHDEHRDS